MEQQIFFVTYYSFINTVTFVVTLFGAVLFLKIPKKSEATKNFGMGLLFYSGISLAFVIQFSINHPYAAFCGIISIICALKAIIYFIRFFFSYPSQHSTPFTKQLNYSLWTVSALVDLYAIITFITHGVIFQSPGEYWYIDSTLFPIINSIFILSYFIIFCSVALWRIKTVNTSSKKHLAILFIGILSCITLPAIYNFLSNIAIMERSLFFSLYSINTTIGCFIIIISYINFTNDHTSFLTKISAIPLFTLLLLISGVAISGFNRVDKTYNESHFEITKILSGRAYKTDDLEYAVSITPKTKREYFIEKGADISIDFKRISYDLEKILSSNTPVLRDDAVIPGKRYVAFQYYDSNLDVLYEAGFNYIAYKEIVNSFGMTLLIFMGIVLIFILVGFPIFFRYSLLKPLQNLMQGFSSVEQGNLTAHCPVKVMDEIGQMTTSFNTMVQRLNTSKKINEGYAINLESMVEKRTKDLHDKNIELKTTMDQLTVAQKQLIHSEKMVSLGELTAGIAHEINNPTNFILNGITPLKISIDDLVSLLHLLEDGASQYAPEEFKKQIDALKSEIDYAELIPEIDNLCDSIKNGAARTQEIVKDLKTFARDDKKEKIQADIHSCLNSTIPIVKSGIKKSITVSTQFESLPLIWCRPGELNQVFMNILSNAAHALSDGGLIDITTKQLNHDFIEIRIKDNGSGIPKDLQEKIFEPFFTTKGVGEGTGLGLSISYGIIKNHNGTIELISEQGAGTEFIITLPVHNSDIKK